MRRIIVCCLAMALMLFIAVPVGGGNIVEAGENQEEQEKLNELLDGDFAFTLTRVCVNVRFFIRPDGTPNVPPGQDAFTDFPDLDLQGFASTNTFGVRGILRYDGNENVAVEDGSLVFILHGSGVTQPGSSPARHNLFTCNGTYDVNPDRSFTQQLNCISTRIAGFEVGEVFTVTGVVHQGQISRDGRTLLLSDTLPNVEDLDSDKRGAFQRICGRSGTAVEIRELNDLEE